MTRTRKRAWQFSLRSLLVGTAAAALAVFVVSWLEVAAGDFVIIVAAVFAVLIEAAVHRRGLRWPTRRSRG